MLNLTNTSQKDWCKACKRLGLKIDKKKGKGSHYRVTNPANNKITIVPYKCHKFISLGIYKTLLSWGFEEDEINDAF